MRTGAVDFELTMNELRAVAGYGVACAEPALVIFRKDRPDDPRPAAALHAGRVFADGGPRSRLQRAAATDAHRAAKDTTTEAASHAATAAGDAAAAAYLHPLSQAAVVGYGVLLLLLIPVLHGMWRPVTAGVALIMVLGIGFSRVGLGVHFVSDVIGGFILGAAWLAATTALFAAWRVHQGRPQDSPAQEPAPEQAERLSPSQPEPHPAGPGR